MISGLLQNPVGEWFHDRLLRRSAFPLRFGPQVCEAGNVISSKLWKWWTFIPYGFPRRLVAGNPGVRDSLERLMAPCSPLCIGSLDLSCIQSVWKHILLIIITSNHSHCAYTPSQKWDDGFMRNLEDQSQFVAGSFRIQVFPVMMGCTWFTLYHIWSRKDWFGVICMDTV